MAGYDPLAYFPQGAEYNPLRRDVIPEQEVEKDFQDDMLERMEAMGLQDTNFQMDLGNYTRPPAEPDENYVPPSTFEEAEASLSAAEQNLQKYQQQLEDFARETQSLVPTDRASAREIKRRAEMIAKGRKDIEISMADVAAARAQITAGKQAATEDPTWWQSTLGYAGETLGVIGKILERTPLLGLGETLVGLASYPAEGLSMLTGSQLGQFGDQDNAMTALALSPPGLAATAAGPWAESPIRERGRQFAKAVGQALGVAESMALDTPVLRKLAQMGLTKNALDTIPTLFGMKEEDARALKWQIGFELATDPLNLVDFGGAKFTKLGRLRELADVNRGTLELATLRKTLEEMPELAAKLPKGFDGSTLVNDLRAAGIDGESATAMSVAFDQLRAKNAKELRDLASLDPQGWAATVRPYIAGSGDAAEARRLEVLDKIADFGDDVDPVLGRTFREQAELGQRLKVWDSMFSRFGGKPWFRAPGKIWSQLTGESILHDIADKPELLELYFANRAFKADAGAEVMRYQQDVAARAAKYLNDLNPEQVAQINEALPNLVENPIYRNMLRDGLVPADLPGALQSAAIDLADLYDESAETLRAIQNRFGLKVADLDAQMGYFGREFSDELKQWLLENPNARAFLFADTTRRSKDTLSTAFLPEERARKFREQDFTESENILRDKFRAMGLPDNIPVWSRDAFGNLIDRAARAKQKAEIRNLYGHFIEAYGETDDAIVAGMRGLIDAEVAMAQAAGTRDPNTWDAAGKAKWLEGKIGQSPAGNVNGLDVMRRANIKLPNDWDELARIAASNFTPDQADEFAKLAKGLYWQHLDQPSKLYKGLSEIKAWFQKAVLARPGSVAKDVQGSMINGLMSGNTKYLDRARRELGSLSDWASGKGKASDLVNRLRGAGVLRTQVDEALQRQSFLESEFPGIVGRAAGRVTKLGIVGGTIKSVTEGLRKAGKAVGLDLKEGKSLAEVTAKATDKMLDARVYFEEVNRVATALKALQDGKSFEGAVQEVFKWWGKFDELSRLDRKVLSQIMFFWAWWARSIPITVRHILTHPVRSRWLMTMMAGDADNDERAPNWLRRMGAWALGKSENGQYKAISLGGSSYFSPTMSMLQGNFVNQAMQGKPMQAASGALMDLLRATPPYIQAIPELAMQHDLFTNKPWWRDKNAKTGSNAKAPTALWWFYSDPSDTSFGSGARSAVSEFFGLKATQTRTGTPYLTMDPMKSWMFGLIPGAEPAMTDVSAFFTAPETGTRPEVDVVKGGTRQLGLPIYNVTVDTAKSDIYEAKQALMQDADKLAGGSLYAESGQIRPNNRTYRGQEIASFLDRAEKQARAQGMSATDAKALAMKKMEAVYPSEWRVLTLYERLRAWEDYILRLEQGESEVDKQLASAIMLTARRGDYNRVARDAAKQDKQRLDSLMLTAR